MARRPSRSPRSELAAYYFLSSPSSSSPHLACLTPRNPGASGRRRAALLTPRPCKPRLEDVLEFRFPLSGPPQVPLFL